MKNPEIKITETKLLSDNWYVLNKVTFDYQKKDGNVESHIREVYDRGNGAAILLYNTEKKTVILTRQFRLPTYLNGNKTGMMIEVCAGLLDQDNAEEAVIRETEEETGYRLNKVQKVIETYMSPGSVTEILYLFVGEYDETMKVNDGGGLDAEQENIEVLEYTFDEAYAMFESGEITDAKTIMLLQHAKIKGLI
ncbi:MULTISPECIES: NUDIX domain-containing protein [Flavobacterium]|uniref:GDP-mannose pyrophosphatase n=1 Tax=Flavobacterium pectinovorum TaxID=29533 RepID=A0AB36P3T4_9FLAO|nr:MULTISPECIES: NUDIX domain-containing protein [Flavobacterium]KIQ17301.1 GDP-mannose pyrophosphatase [Flavobacterium sp. MEB061]OXB05065.1 GDP-mannose pyrophosphatase [Flavobacterium pectinovorum]SHL29059.1 nudix-type nucleoside diphosphatase, YffH/AdpP family [Flavobacterium pectinovorum]